MNTATKPTTKNLFKTFFNDFWSHASRPHIQVLIDKLENSVTCEPPLDLRPYSKDGVLTLNVSVDSIGEAMFFDDCLSIQMRFNSKAHTLFIPYTAVSVLYDADKSDQAIVMSDANLYAYSEVLDVVNYKESIDLIKEVSSNVPKDIAAFSFTKDPNGLAAVIKIANLCEVDFMVEVANSGGSFVEIIPHGSSISLDKNLVTITTPNDEDDFLIPFDDDSEFLETISIFMKPNTSGKSEIFSDEHQIYVTNPKMVYMMLGEIKKDKENLEKELNPVDATDIVHQFSETTVAQTANSEEVEQIINESSNIIRFPGRKG